MSERVFWRVKYTDHGQPYVDKFDSRQKAYAYASDRMNWPESMRDVRVVRVRVKARPSESPRETLLKSAWMGVVLAAEQYAAAHPDARHWGPPGERVIAAVSRLREVEANTNGK